MSALAAAAVAVLIWDIIITVSYVFAREDANFYRALWQEAEEDLADAADADPAVEASA